MLAEPGREERTESGASPGPIAASPMVDGWLGVTIGRYRLEALLGGGGQGAVYRAVDEVLDRPVAIKVLRHDLGFAARVERIEAEARALARLRSPAIVGVHDVGIAELGPYIVMELVDGETLGGWRARGADRRAIEAVLRESAGALAAAHAAGVIHGDVKPDNILVDRAGHAHLADFGLAVTDGDDDERLGRGTRGYRAPEISTGARTIATDVYAFGVLACEMLAYPRFQPGAGALDRPAVEAALHGAGVTRAVRRVLARCVAADPRARPASMAEVVAALERRRRGPLIAAIAVAVVALALGLVATRGGRAGPAEPVGAAVETACTRSAAELDANLSRARAELAPIVAGHAADHRRLAALLGERLDGFGTSWRGAHQDLCRIADTDRTSAPRRCLDRAVDEVAAIARAVRADRRVLQGLVRRLSMIDPPSTCDDEAVIARLPPGRPGPGAARIAKAVRARLTDARALFEAGLGDDARRVAGETLVTATDAGDDVLIAEATRELGAVQLATGDAAYVATLQRAIAVGTRAQHHSVVAEAAVLLARDGTAASRQRAEEAIQRSGRTELLGILRMVDGAGRFGAGDYAGARDHFAAALRLLETGPVALIEWRIAALNNLAIAWGRDGYLDGARAYLEAADQMGREARGPYDPSGFAVQANLADLFVFEGDAAAAAGRLDEALATARGFYDLPHHDVAYLLLARAGAAADLDDRATFDAVVLEVSRLLDALPADAALQAEGWLRLAQLNLDRGQPADADRALTRLGRLEVEAYRAELSRVQGRAAARRGAWTEARRALQAALAIQRKVLRAGHPDTAETLADLGDALCRSGRPAAGRQALRAATVALRIDPLASVRRNRTGFRLARCLPANAASEATALATEALRALALRDGRRELEREIAAWLEAQP